MKLKLKKKNTTYPEVKEYKLDYNLGDNVTPIKQNTFYKWGFYVYA